MEEANQGDSVKRKSDRPTMFVTILNATAQELHHAHKALESAGIGEDYRVLLSDKVIQAVGEHELREALDEVKMTRNDKRTMDIRHAFRHIAKAIDGLNMAVGTANQNIEYISNSINNNQNYVHTQTTQGLASAKYEIAEALNYLPKEGEEW